jgi:hypothetical protein
MVLNQKHSAKNHNYKGKCNDEANSASEEHYTDTYIELPFQPVCEPVSDDTLSSLLFYAPLALTFIYAECEVDMQLLAAQQGEIILCIFHIPDNAPFTYDLSIMQDGDLYMQH